MAESGLELGSLTLEVQFFELVFVLCCSQMKDFIICLVSCPLIFPLSVAGNHLISTWKVYPAPDSGERGDFSKRGPSSMLWQSTIISSWLLFTPWPYASVLGPGPYLALSIPNLGIGVWSWTPAYNLWTEDPDTSVSSGHCTEHSSWLYLPADYIPCCFLRHFHDSNCFCKSILWNYTFHSPCSTYWS